MCAYEVIHIDDISTQDSNLDGFYVVMWPIWTRMRDLVPRRREIEVAT